MAFWLDDVVIGDTFRFGDWTFTAEDIIRFARRYDPQPFHVDPAAAEKSHFGGLIASGWHTASIGMKLIVRHLDRLAAEAEARGEPPVPRGASPGFRNLRWARPVRAGDTLTYRRTVTDKRVTATRPGWGLVFATVEATSQRGEVVFSFDSVMFAARRS